MPKIKLRGWQFKLISSALMDRYDKELLAYHKLLCNALGENFDISDERDINFGIFHTKKVEAIDKHTQLSEIAQAKVNLFEAEHRGTTLNTDEEIEFAKLQSNLREEKDIIAQIESKLELANAIKKMAVSIESRADDVDIIEKYDDEPKDPPVEYDDGDDDDGFFPTAWNLGD